MPEKKPEFYQLSIEADADLENIFDFTLKEFGFDQAIDYLSAIESCIKQLLIHPSLGRQRTELGKTISSFPVMQHILYYQKKSNCLLIIRVLHRSQDMPRFSS